MRFRCLHEHPSIFTLLLRGLLPRAPPEEARGTTPPALQGNLNSSKFTAHGASEQLGSSFCLPTGERGFSCCKPQLKGRALSQLLGNTSVVNGESWQLSLSPVTVPGGGHDAQMPWPLTPALPTRVFSLRGDAPSTHNTSSHLLKTPVLHVFCLLEEKQSLTFQGRKGKAPRDAGHSEQGLLSRQQRRAVGSITPGVKQHGERRGPVLTSATGAGPGGGGHQRDVIVLPGTGNFRTSAPGADRCLQERPNPSCLQESR